MFAAGELLFPAINVNDSVTKSKFDNLYGCRHSLIDGINRGVDVMLGGKVALRRRLRRGGQGLRPIAEGQGCRVVIGEVDQICALQAAMEGYQVARLEDVLDVADIFITTTGNKGIITAEHMARMKHQAIVGNIGHFDNEIDMAGLARMSDVRRVEVKPQVHEFVFPDGHSIIVLSEGPAAEPGQRHRAPELRDVDELHQPGAGPDRAVHEDRAVPPRRLRAAEAARRAGGPLHLDALGVRLTGAVPAQADYIGVPVAGPYKHENYRY